MLYLDFVDNISLLGFGDIIKDNCGKIKNIAQTLRYPTPSGEPLRLDYKGFAGLGTEMG